MSYLDMARKERSVKQRSECKICGSNTCLHSSRARSNAFEQKENIVDGHQKMVERWNVCGHDEFSQFLRGQSSGSSWIHDKAVLLSQLSCQALSVGQRYGDTFQITFEPLSWEQPWELTIRIPTEAWYEKLRAKRDPNDTEFIQRIKSEVREFIALEKQKQKSRQGQPPEQDCVASQPHQEVNQLCAFCDKKQHPCKHIENKPHDFSRPILWEYEQKTVYCHQHLQGPSQEKYKCKQFLLQKCELHIPGLNNSPFKFLTRMEADVNKRRVSEMLMYSFTEHIENPALVQSPRFWYEVLRVMKATTQYYLKLGKTRTLDEIPVRQVYLNFGEWESAISGDPHLRNCHGHAHLCFGKRFIFALEKDPDKYDSMTDKWKKMGALYGHYYPVQDLFLNDLIRFQRDVLVPEEVDNLSHTVTELKTTVTELKSGMDLILEHFGIKKNEKKE